MFRPTEISSSAPTVNDDFSAGFRQGMLWFNSTTSNMYVCDDDAVGAASWTAFNTGATYNWADWTPTFTFTGGTATGVTYVARYISINDLVTFYIDYQATADGDITDCKISLPTVPADQDVYLPITHYYSEGGSVGNDNIAYIDLNDKTEGNRQILHARFQTIANAATFKLFYSGFYEENPS